MLLSNARSLGLHTFQSQPLVVSTCEKKKKISISWVLVEHIRGCDVTKLPSGTAAD